MAGSSTTIRVTTETRDRLGAIASRRGKTTGDLLAEIAVELDEDALIESAEASWNAMSEEELARYHEESAELEKFTAPGATAE